MKILAIESSTSRRGVAFINNNELVWESSESLATADRTLPLIQQGLAAAGWKSGEIERVAIGLGPGSFTGVRLAIATAIGFEAVHGTPALGVRSFDALAHRLSMEGHRGRHALVADAQRGEFALGLYSLTPEGAACAENLRLASRAELEAMAAAGIPMHGPDMPKLASHVTPRYPDAHAIALLAGRERIFTTPGSLEPIHLRPVAFVKAPPPRFQIETS